MSIREDKISQRPLEDVLPEAFLGYSKHVILQRAVPDVRDGLKPVHRRILYTMDELGMQADKPYSKSARLVGDCMGRYHPHGDSSIYDAAVRMAQPWATRYPMVDGQGNFGSLDGDSAAAMRYTEVRMTTLAQLMTQDIEKNTTPFKANYDQRLKEPVVLPSPFPYLLVNGGSGIAVGMMSNMPPHNLREVVDAIIMQIDKPQVTLEELMSKIGGPDFPTGGLLIGTEGILSAYQNGRGKVTLRGKALIEQGQAGKSLLVITEIPYQVNKATLAGKIETLAATGKIEGISEVRDESDREGIRLVVECRKDADPREVLRLLYKYTQLEDTFGIINLVIAADGTPKVLGLKEINAAFIAHRKSVVWRRTEFDLEKARLKEHILAGLMLAISNLDEVLALIRASKTPALARAGLITGFELTEVQAQAILDMRLQNLTNMELAGIQQDHADIVKLIAELENILADERKVLDIIKKELQEIGEKYGDERRTRILPEEMRHCFDPGVLTEPENPVEILRTVRGFWKRIPLAVKKNKGNAPPCSFKDGDTLAERIVCTDKDMLYLFTRSGKFYCLKAKLIPEAKAKDKGVHLANIFPLPAEEEIVSIIPGRDEPGGWNFLFVTKDGQVLRSPAADFVNSRSAEAIGLREGDNLVKAFLSEGRGDLLLATGRGQVIRYSETEISLMGRKARGVKGMTLNGGDWVVAALLLNREEERTGGDLVTLTERGFVKRTPLAEYKAQGRAGKGVAIAKVDSVGTGFLVDVAQGEGEDALHVLQSSGLVTRLALKELKAESRAKAGVQRIPVLLQDYAIRLFNFC